MTALAYQTFSKPAFSFAGRKSAGALPGLFDEIAVDLFAGGGGMSLGFELATGRCVDEAVNHDADAIWMHQANHRNTRHWRDSVWRVDPLEVAAGRPVGWLHGSPDCTHFSIARGGKPVRKEIRGLAWCVLRWTAKLLPRLLTMENVREFLTWGPLVQKRAGRNRYLWELQRTARGDKRLRMTVEGPHCDDGSARAWRGILEALGYTAEPMMVPDKKRAGQTFRQWLGQLQDLGYKVEWKVLDAADYGAPTHRRRLFIVARRDGRPIRWPEKTHGPDGSGLKPYRTAAECIDFSHPCPSIFGRKKPLADNTLRRIVRGLVKFSIESADPYIVRVDRGGPEFRGQSLADPFPTLCADHGFGLTVPYTVGAGGRSPDPRDILRPAGTILPKDAPSLVLASIIRCAHGETCSTGARRWGSGAHDILSPLGAITGSKDYAVTSAFLYDRHRERDGQLPRVRGLDRPLGVIDATGNCGNLVVPFLYTNVIGPQAGRRVDRPLGVITSVHNKFQLLIPHLVECANGTWNAGFRPIWRPMAALTATPKGGSWSLITPMAVKFYRTGVCQPLTEPLDTVTGRHRFGMAAMHLTKLRGSGGWCSLTEPLDAICAGAATFGPTAAWVVKHYGGNYDAAGIDCRDPLGTITAVDHHALGAVHLTHLRGTHGRGIGGSGLSMHDVFPTITAGGRHLYLTSAGLASLADRPPMVADGSAIYTAREWMGPSDNPAINRGFWRVHDLLRRFLGDAAPLPIVRACGRQEADGSWRPPQEYLIFDIGMRMLTPRELLSAQFGPELARDYVLTGTRESQVAKIGNSVPPLLGAAVVRVNWHTEESEVAA